MSTNQLTFQIFFDVVLLMFEKKIQIWRKRYLSLSFLLNHLLPSSSFVCFTHLSSGHCSGEGNGTPLQYFAWKIPWMEEPGRLQSMGSLRVGHEWATSLSLFHFHALEKEMATHSSVLAWRIPGAGEPGGLMSMGSHRIGHDWSDLAAAAQHCQRDGECCGKLPRADNTNLSYWHCFSPDNTGVLASPQPGSSH